VLARASSSASLLDGATWTVRDPVSMAMAVVVWNTGSKPVELMNAHPLPLLHHLRSLAWWPRRRPFPPPPRRPARPRSPQTSSPPPRPVETRSSTWRPRPGTRTSRRSSSAARNAALDMPLHLAARAGAHKVIALLVASSTSTSSAPSLRSLTRATKGAGRRRCTTPCGAATRPRRARSPPRTRALVGLCGGAGESPFYMAAAGGGWRS
jgi:hypothetical protein